MAAVNEDKRANLPPISISISIKKKSCVSPCHALSRNNAKDENWKPLYRKPLHSNYITDAVTELNEHASAKKRRRVGNHPVLERGVAGSAHELESGGGSAEDDSGVFDILQELGTRTEVIQLVASSGGLISHWNDAFAQITKPSLSLKAIPLTIFELIDSKSLPSLFGMLALSLHNVGIVGCDVEDFPSVGSSSDPEEDLDKRDDTSSENEDTARCADAAENLQLSRPLSPSHLSITLPCRAFPKSSTRYNITVVFMNEMASMKRCFLGILTPSAAECHYHDVADDSLLTSSCDGSRCSPIQASCRNANDTPERNGTAGTWRDLPRGKILRVDDDLLCRILLGPSIQ